MVIKKDIKIIISLSILIGINLLFINKYLSRITEYAWIGVVIMCFIYIATWIIKDKIRLSEYTYSLLTKSAVFIFFIASVFLVKSASPESLHVDRWSVISSFWEKMFHNENPYSAISYLGNPPGPMPFYFILALPFYLIGEIGYMAVIGAFILLFISEKTQTTNATKLWSTFFLIGSAYLFWEVVCRSTVFFNSTIILGCIIWFITINKHEKNKSLYLWAIAIGLSLSTRSVFAIPVIIITLASIRRREIGIKKLTIAVLVAGVVFCLTFLPLLIMFPDSFLKLNPFIIQSTYLMPASFSVGFLILAAGASLLCKQTSDDYFYSGIGLFITILGYFIYHIFKSGFNEAYYNSIADISYFIMCAPFLQYYVLKSAGSPR